MVGRQAGQMVARYIDIKHLHVAIDENVVDAVDRIAAEEGPLRPMTVERELGILQACSQQSVGRGGGNGVEISAENNRPAAIRVAQPLLPQQSFRLQPALLGE